MTGRYYPGDLPDRPRIGLALSGGGARGLAHIGVMQTLQTAGIAIDALSGTSMGAIVAGLFAAGVDFQDIDPVVNQLLGCTPETFLTRGGTLAGRVQGLLRSVSYLKNNLVGLGSESGACLEEELRRCVGQRHIEQTSLPLALTATDIRTGELAVLTRGPLARAMHASAALPGVFTPVSWGERLLCDGGIISNVPVRAAKGLGVDLVLAVDACSPPPKTVPKNGLGVLLQANHICAHKLKEFELGQADLTVTVELPASIQLFDFDESTRIIEAGRAAAVNSLDKIREVVGQITPFVT